MTRPNVSVVGVSGAGSNIVYPTMNGHARAMVVLTEIESTFLSENGPRFA